MAKLGRNDPCPCGSGKKYKKCCLPLHEESRAKEREAAALASDTTDLDELSNSVVDLIDAGRLDDAEAACRELLTRYPDQIDGTERLAAVYEAKGEKKPAAEYYRKAAEFAKGSPGFDQELIDWYSSKANELEASD
jgi:tetratricopeptide (TPR) repeat protein